MYFNLLHNYCSVQMCIKGCIGCKGCMYLLCARCFCGTLWKNFEGGLKRLTEEKTNEDGMKNEQFRCRFLYRFDRPFIRDVTMT